MRIVFLFMMVFPLISHGKAKIEANFNAEFNAQVKSISNTKEAKDLGQDWNNENIHLTYGNIFGRFAFKRSSLVYNWFLRYSESELYKSDYSASNFSNYPRRLLKRDALKFSKKDAGDRSFTESVLNRFAYE